jgi:hypothetical protein
MKAGRLGAARPAPRMSRAVILFWVGPYRMAIDAGALREIRNDLCFTPATTGCQAILSAHSLLGVSSGGQKRLLVLRPGRVGVCVDRVERMIEIGEVHPLPQAFQGAEKLWYSGIILVDGIVCPLMNAETLLEEGKASETAARDRQRVEEKPSPEAFCP